MKPTTIQFEYDDAKLEAIRICLADKQTDLNHELETLWIQPTRNMSLLRCGISSKRRKK